MGSGPKRGIGSRELVLVCASLLAILASSVVAVAVPGRAATPGPSPSPFPSLPPLPIEAWLDAPLASDAAPGTALTIGALLWWPEQAMLMPEANSFFRLHPASGEAPPSESPAEQDWTGHIVATLTVPPGGVGRLEIGIAGSACTPAGECQRADSLYTLAGVGPPAGAALPQIADASIETLLPSLVVGEPTTVDLVLRPRVAWPDFPLPEHLVLVVRQPRSEPLAELAAPLVDPETGAYRSELVVDEAGHYILDVATTEGATARDAFTDATVRIEALPPLDATPGSAPPDTGAPGSDDGGAEGGASDDMVALLAIVAGLAMLVSAGVVYLAVRER